MRPEVVHHDYIARSEGGDEYVSLLFPRSAGVQRPPKGKQRQSIVPNDVGLSGVRILCVEDDDAVAEITMSLLAEFGCFAIRARNADEALTMSLSEIDMVFSDVLMPCSLDGIGLVQEIMKRRPELPVILASGYVISPERLQGLDVQLLSKPYTAQALQEVLLTAL
jgi:CheY-like chemotaxis protein